MMGHTSSRLLILIVTLAGLAGCTRNSSTSSSGGSLTISLPSAQQMGQKNQQFLTERNLVHADGGIATGSTGGVGTSPGLAAAGTASAGVVQVLVVNITGSGLSSPIYYQWSDNGQGKAAPTSITLNVPQGPARQVQVMMAVQTATGMAIDLGSTTVDLSSSSQVADVTLQPVTASTGLTGRVIGQYETSANSGPTGVVNVVYHPPGGMPPITVGQSEMFNGYFSFFGLQDLPFDYVLSDGTVLYSGLTLDPSTTALLNGASGSRAVAFIPANASASGSSGADPDNLLYFGFFGPAAASTSQGACYAPGGTMQGVTSPSGNNILWQGTAIGTPWATLQLNGQGGVFAGGTGQTCTGSSNYLNYMFLPLAGVSERDSALGFRGPYITGGYSGLTFTQTTPGLLVSWSYLPGATSGIDGTEIFYLPGGGSASQSATSDPPYRNQIGFACDQLVSQYGFTPAGKVSTSSSSITITGLTTSSDVLIVACPYKSGILSGTTYFSSALSGAQVPPPCSSTYQPNTSGSYLTSSNGYISPASSCTLQAVGPDSNYANFGYGYGFPFSTPVMASKFYFEVRVEALDASTGGVIRVGAENSTLISEMSSNSSQVYLTSSINGQAAAYSTTGLCQFGESSITSGTACPVAQTGSVIGMAIDTTTGGVWWSVDGVWSTANGLFNSSTPTFLVWGLAPPYASGGIYPFIGMNAPISSSPRATLVTKGSLLKSQPPTGFTAIEP